MAFTVRLKGIENLLSNSEHVTNSKITLLEFEHLHHVCDSLNTLHDHSQAAEVVHPMISEVHGTQGRRSGPRRYIAILRRSMLLVLEPIPKMDSMECNMSVTHGNKYITVMTHQRVNWNISLGHS